MLEAMPIPSQCEPVPGTERDPAALYLEHRRLLLHVAINKFRVPDADAENLLQDVFVSFLQSGRRVENVRAWLVAAVCNASRHYWRMHSRTEQLPENVVERADPCSQHLAEQVALRMTVKQALGYLPQRCRETLHLHYFEGRSASDVANVLETTSRYAEKLIHNCLQRVRETYRRIMTVHS